MRDKRWEQDAKSTLEGRTIRSARYMTRQEADEMGWAHRPLVLFLDNGALFCPAQDEEGNDAGVFFISGANGRAMFPRLR